MSAGAFKQDGWGWRINLIRQRIGEWSEYQLSQLDTDWDLEFIPFKLLWRIIEFFLWSIIALILVWMLWQGWLLLRPYWRRWQRSTPNFAPVVTPINTPLLSAADWFERSQTARVEADYRRGIFCLYQAMLSLLNEREIILTQLSYTDEEYRRSLLEKQISFLQSYELLLSSHQRLCFGRVEADRSLFERCQQAFNQIQRQ